MSWRVAQPAAVVSAPSGQEVSMIMGRRRRSWVGEEVEIRQCLFWSRPGDIILTSASRQRKPAFRPVDVDRSEEEKHGLHRPGRRQHSPITEDGGGRRHPAKR